MRRLMLLRHSKAEKIKPGQSDRDRALNSRGRDDAPRIGNYIERHALLPDRVVVSPATRTRETWELLAEALSDTPKAVFDKRIYEASAKTILSVVAETADDVHTLLVIGHNPGLQELAHALIASGDVETRERLNEEFPTSALAVIDFPFDAWGKLHAQSGRLDRFVGPRSFDLSTD